MLSRKKLNNITFHVMKAVNGKVLSHAFVIINRNDLKINVVRERSSKPFKGNKERINVYVKNGIVKNSWIG